MNQQEVLAALANREQDAKSMKEIAIAMGFDIASYTDWIRVERSLCRILRRLVKWDEVGCSRKQNTEGPRFWYSVYWRIEPQKQEEITEVEIVA